jgi:hypothetical protein
VLNVTANAVDPSARRRSVTYKAVDRIDVARKGSAAAISAGARSDRVEKRPDPPIQPSETCVNLTDADEI